MELGISTVKDLIETIFISFGGLVFIIAAITYALNKKQHYFAVTNNCINKFQDNFITDKNLSTIKCLKYLDLVSEQLFYIENKYVPPIISVEWIDGILDFLPIIIKNNNQYFTNPNNKFGRELTSSELNLFPRISRTFSVKTNNYCLDLTLSENVDLRKELILTMVMNIHDNRNFFYKWFIKKKVKKFLRRLY